MVDWEPWGAAAFARARREAKPVLLSISAGWCRACHEMDRTTYADEVVGQLIRQHFVPVRVDTDERPDINERYNLGGWPTTAFLTAEGQLVTGGTFVAADRMRTVLERVVDAYAARAAEFRMAAGATATATATATEYTEYTEYTEHDQATEYTEYTEYGQQTDAGPDQAALIEEIFSTFDPEYGGFGVEPKFPHAAPVRLALALFRDSGDARWRDIAGRTLDGMWEGGLWDAAAGGFRRYAATRDWQQPHLEKLLETNAALLAVYAEASAVLGRSADRDRTAAIARFITTALRCDSGGYFGSDSERALYVDGNAEAASALLAAASALGDSTLARDALASFERVLLACYKPGSGLAHQPDGRVRGLLGDHIAAIAALLDAHDVTDGEPYGMMAEEIGHYMVRALWDESGDGFFDRAAQEDDIGLLRTRRKPFIGNAEAAIAMTRLQRVSREFDFTAQAAGALRAAGREALRQGPLAAHYVLAARQVG